MKLLLPADEVLMDVDEIAFAVALTPEQQAARRDVSQTQVMFKSGGSVFLALPFGEFVEEVFRALHPEMERS